MRIDASLPLPENQQTSKVAGSGSSVQQNRSAPASSSQDDAQLSADNRVIQNLKAQLAKLPEVRQDRVDALRQAVNNGSYLVSSQQLADAIGSDLTAGQFRIV
jgi:negative regulator of flagellin synthesis FlgM